MTFLKKLSQWFNGQEGSDVSAPARYRESDFGDSIAPSTTEHIGNSTRDRYVALGPDDTITLRGITRSIMLAGTGHGLSKDQMERQKAMGALLNTYARGNFPAAHELSLVVTRGPLSVRYGLYHRDSRGELIHELLLTVDR